MKFFSIQPLGKAWNISAIAVGAILASVIAFLLIVNYKSQISLQKNALEQLMQDTEKRSKAFSYFYSERKNDLRNLARSKVISTYFENKALEMTMKYGLRASLIAMADQFHKLIREREIGDKRIYSRMAFVNSSGEVLVDTAEADVVPSRKENPERLSSPEKGVPLLLMEDGAIIILTAYFFKGKYAGYIMGWVIPESAYNQLIEIDPAKNRFLCIFSGDRLLWCPVEMDARFRSPALKELRKMQSDAPTRFLLRHTVGKRWT